MIDVFALNGDNVEADILVPVDGIDVMLGSFDNQLLLGVGDKGFGFSVSVAFAYFHLKKYQQFIFQQTYHVYFAMSVAVVSLQYLKSLFLKKRNRQIFAIFASGFIIHRIKIVSLSLNNRHAEFIFSLMMLHF